MLAGSSEWGMIFWMPPRYHLSALNIFKLDFFRNMNMHASWVFCGVQIPSLSACNCQLILGQVILTRTGLGSSRSCVVFDPEADMLDGKSSTFAKWNRNPFSSIYWLTMWAGVDALTQQYNMYSVQYSNNNMDHLIRAHLHSLLISAELS